ncbi:globin domain-containing protein [Spirosoma koreense]
MLSENQLATVKKSWRLLRDVDPALLGDVFYSRLFMTHPELRALFKGPLEAQYTKFIDTLSFLVSQLHRLDEFTREVELVGQRHKQYGVKADHYDAVGESLLWTLQSGLGRDWSEDVAEAWTTLYTIIAQKMQEPVTT